MFTLRARDIIIAHGHGVMSLEVTKKNQHDAVTIDDSFIAELCQRRLAQLSDHDLFIGHSPSVCRTKFHQLLALLQLQRFGFKWYSLRRGGATYNFGRHGNMGLTLQRGRWESSRTARIYITDGLQALNELTLTDDDRERIAWAAVQLAQS